MHLNKFIKNKRASLIIFLLAYLLLGVLIQVGAAYVLDGVMSGIGGLEQAGQEYEEVLDNLLSDKPGMLIYVIIVAPMIEEFVFRLGLIGLGQKFLNFWIVNTISSVLFGIYHGNIVQGTYAFLLGFVLGIIYKYSKGFVASAIVHISINTCGVYLAPWLKSTETPLMNIILGMAVLIFAGALIYGIIKYEKIIKESA